MKSWDPCCLVQQGHFLTGGGNGAGDSLAFIWQERACTGAHAHTFIRGPRTPPFGPFLCTRFRNQKIRKPENQKVEPQNDSCAGTTLVQITEMESVKNSLFEGHEVI